MFKGCLKVLAVIIFLPAFGWMLGVYLADHIGVRDWTVARLGGTADVQVDGGKYSVYESATYGAAVQLVNSDGDEIPLSHTPVPLEIKHDGRTFTQVGFADLKAGMYTLRAQTSPFAAAAALVAVGPNEADLTLRRVTFGLVFAWLLPGLAITFLIVRFVVRRRRTQAQLSPYG